MAGLLPTAQELSNFRSVDDVIEWGGMRPEIRGSYKVLLGAPESLRVMAAIPISVFITMITGWKVPAPLRVPSVSLSSTPKGVSPTATQSSTPADQACGSLAFQAARLAMGLPFSIDPSSPAPSPTVALTGGSGGLRRTVKMSHVVDQTMEHEVEIKSPDEIALMSETYIKRLGGEPEAEEDPTAEQVTCVSKLIEAKIPPSPDLAIFGPYGAAIHRRLKFTASIFVNNQLVVQELAGPPTAVIWKACMAVLKTVFIFLEAVNPARIDKYINHIDSLHTTYGKDAWGIIYQADVDMRTQEFARIKTRLDRKYNRDEAMRSVIRSVGGAAAIPVDPNEYDPAMPWDGVYYRAINGSKAESYWNKNVHKPAMMLITRHRSECELIHDHSAHPAAGRLGAPNAVGYEEQTWVAPGGASSAGGQRVHPAAKRVRSRTPRGAAAATPGGDYGNDLSTKDEQGRYLTNRRGKELCRKFQSGHCTGGNVCPTDSSRVHQCHWCLKQHAGDMPGVCPANHSQGQQSGGKSAGKGGKGGKSGKGKGKSPF